MYSNVTKVLVESRQGSNLLYLPLDKIMQMNSEQSLAPAASTMNNSSANGSVPSPATNESTSRNRESRLRDRDTR